jgi:hypothetical protein
MNTGQRLHSGWLFGGRRRPSSNRSMTARETAHRLWPDKVAADPADDKPRTPTPNERMNQLLKDARNATRTNTDKDPLQ